MKLITLLKSLVPISAKRKYWRYKKKRAKALKRRVNFENKSTEEAFNYIYATNYWSGEESVSGGGSDTANTHMVRKIIEDVIEGYKPNTLIDIPCGDFNWMKTIDFGKLNYIGGDIVKELIDENEINYNGDNSLRFIKIDLIKDTLPEGDILLNRDCLVHLSFNDIIQALSNIKASNITYLLTTTFPDVTTNIDIATGDWRPINLELPPFNLNSPIKLYNEHYSNPKYKSKSLGLWRIKDL